MKAQQNLSYQPDDIFMSCRKGNLKRIQYLIEHQDVDLNVRDCWDSTPLYYACLCGYDDVVKVLLENGARCERSTYDGERCWYSALTQSIKQLLSDANIRKQTKSRNDYDEFCRKLMTYEELSDISFSLLDGSVLKLHKCVLAARSKYFSQSFKTKWKDVKVIQIKRIEADVFRQLISYIYTSTLTCMKQKTAIFYSLAKQCQLPHLYSVLKQTQGETDWFEQTKSIKIAVPTVIVDHVVTRMQLQNEFFKIINSGLPDDVKAYPRFETQKKNYRPDFFFDICLRCQGYKFFCNKVFISASSEYFRALLTDHFHEIVNDKKCPEITIRNIKPIVLAQVLYYMYTGSLHTMNVEVILDLFDAADFFLLPRLKKMCGNSLCYLINEENVLSLFHLSRFHSLCSLESKCCEFLAYNLSQIIGLTEFRDIVVQDSKDIKQREETDSIAIVDDIRYHLHELISNSSSKHDQKLAAMGLKAIKKMLKELNLNA